MYITHAFSRLGAYLREEKYKNLHSININIITKTNIFLVTMTAKI